MAKLRPVFLENGTVTAANASGINDGAGAMVMTTADIAEQRGLNPLGRIVGYGVAGVEPKYMGIGPVEAIKNALSHAGMSLGEMDLIEINEAFSVVPMVAIKELNINIDKVNIHGGAVSLGHPIGCSGARIIMSLINALKVKDKKLGIASICIGGGEATAILIENIK